MVGWVWLLRVPVMYTISVQAFWIYLFFCLSCLSASGATKRVEADVCTSHCFRTLHMEAASAVFAQEDITHGVMTTGSTPPLTTVSEKQTKQV